MPDQAATERLDHLMSVHEHRINEAVSHVGLPLHVVFIEEIARSATAFLDTARSLYPQTIVSFAAKSNPCRGAIRTARDLGLGLDAASEYEFLVGREEGIPARRITCNGNAKSDAYLASAIQEDALLCVDGDDELDRIESIAAERATRPTLLVRLRGMPLAGLTSADQTTASEWTKFGFHLEDAERVFGRIRRSPHLHFAGVSAHIGTQIARVEGYRCLLEHLFDVVEQGRAMGLPSSHIDIGGGFPIRFLSEEDWHAFTNRLRQRLRGEVPVEASVTWNDEPMGYAHARGIPTAADAWLGKSYWTAYPASEMLRRILDLTLEDGRSVVERLHALGGPALIVEPGRSLMASSGVTLTEVMGVKTVLGHRVVALDMGINNHGTNLISPDIFPARVLPPRDDDCSIEAFLAGRLCFSGDMISKAKVRLNRLPVRGDRFVLYQTGAYGADHFASHSCGFPRPAKIAVRPDGQLELWRPPDTFQDVFGSRDDLRFDPS